MSYSCDIPCTKESLKKVRGFVKRSLKGHVPDQLDLAAMVLAMDEICANLIIHGHNCNAEDHLEITIHLQGKEGVLFKIYDDDEMFDISEYESPSLKELIETKRKGGLGLNIVKKIMDDIEIRKEKGKNCCLLYKKVEVR